MKFKVLLQQYVERTAAVEVEASSWEEARDIALRDASAAEWEDGDDAHDVDCYGVYDGPNLVYER